MLNDDYPVFPGYMYVVDGHIITSDVGGCVRDLKRNIHQNYLHVVEKVETCRIMDHKPNTMVNDAPWMKPPPTEIVFKSVDWHPGNEKQSQDRLKRDKKCWRLTITFPNDDRASIDIWEVSHKKAVKAFEEAVQALKDGKQLPVGLHYSVTSQAARTNGWKITKVKSL